MCWGPALPGAKTMLCLLVISSSWDSNFNHQSLIYSDLNYTTPHIFFRVLKYQKKSFKHLKMFSITTCWGDCINVQEISFTPWLFEDRSREGKKLLPDLLDWLSYLAGRSKCHHEILISCIFLQSSRWFSDGICKYKPSQVYHTTCYNLSALIGGKVI